jgi:peptidoglycan/LPS O-acetylase OafA/YrhL
MQPNQNAAALAEPESSALLGWSRRRQIPNLDALRGISILWVFLHHVPALPWSFARAFQENGRHGVSFFFVISGFLICTLFLREERHTGQIALLKFYGRRVLRLMPLYYIVLLLYCALVLGFGVYSVESRELFLQKLPSYIFYYSNVVPHSTEGPFFFAWSLAVEEQFYLVFGLMMRWLSKRAVLGLMVALLVVKVIAFALFGPALLSGAALRALLSYQEAILMGVLLAFVMNTERGFGLVARYLARPWVTAALGVAIAVIGVASPIDGKSSAHALILYVLMTLFVGAVSVLPELGGLKGRAAAHIGKVSYGMYLLHMLVINSARKVIDDPVFVFVVGVPATVALATVVYRCIEAPILRLRNRFEPEARAKRQKAEASPRPVAAPRMQSVAPVDA